MDKIELLGINELCKRLQTTSRTLRFYEQKGIISSTRDPFTKIRLYTKDQIIHIRNVMALRALGLSIKSISELQQKNTDLKEAILSRRAEIFAHIAEKNREINLLNEALAILESGEDLFDRNLNDIDFITSSEYEKIVSACTEAIITGDSPTLYRYIGTTLASYMPQSAFEAVRKDTLQVAGEFVAKKSIEQDKSYPNIVYSNVDFSKMGVRIKFVFHNGRIDGLWLNYYELR
ncbi:MAG: MerR family transcriptional regulator [Clostridia bacterium]|nr:MerR family transcriptional regulator [Clostridia bacterium]